MNYSAFIVLMVLLSTSSADDINDFDLSFVVSIDGCPQPVEIDGGLNLDRYLGKWYEIKRTNSLYEFDERCVITEYKLDSNDNVFVNISGIKEDNTDVWWGGSAEKGSLSNVFNATFIFYSPIAQYWIVDTDYDTYSLVVSCNNVNDLLYVKNAWILSRKPKLESDIVDSLVAKLETIGVGSANLRTTTQDCDN
uniref:Lipocalin/cytosolic fatty-acid binding domain-containing protein n=1 Tax=Tetranychus truncatus TaxID=93132 RepID=A0A3G5AQQ7_9ACAR|nr:hypothetical protein LOTGIDRAFT_197767 isoform X1 [Tetranychus truncatus]